MTEVKLPYRSPKELRENLKELQARYEYLKYGGEWQRELSDNVTSLRKNAEDNYAAGFLDAMRTIGVKP